MAYDKIIPVHYRLDHCINYVLDENKIRPKPVISGDATPQFVTGINCEADAVYAQMQATKRRWDKHGGVLGYHIIHSYAPGEVTPQEAHAAGVEFAQRLLGERFEAIVATHLDQQHYHCHIVFNSVSCVDGKKYRSDFKSYFSDLRGISNAVSRERGLTVIEPENKGKHYAQWDAERRNRPTVASLIQRDIDVAIKESVTFGMFLSTLRRFGYSVKYSANDYHIAIKPPESSYFFHLEQLRKGYTERDIRARIKASEQDALHEPLRQSHSRQRFKVQSGILSPSQKLHGFRALYVYYLYFLGIRRPGGRPLPFPVRREVTKLKRYQRQFALIREYRLENGGQVAMLHDALQASIDVLTDERKELYKYKTDCAEAQIQCINQELRQLRSKLKTCVQIETDIPHIRRQMKSCVEWSQQNKKGEQNKEKDDKVNQSRSHRHFNPVR